MKLRNAMKIDVESASTTVGVDSVRACSFVKSWRRNMRIVSARPKLLQVPLVRRIRRIYLM